MICNNCLRNYPASLPLRPPARFSSTQRKVRPSRMVLSPNVGKPGPVGKRRGAVGNGLNRREANLSPQRMLRATAQAPASKNKDKSDFKHLKMAQSLSVVSRATRAEVQQRIQSMPSFENLGLLPVILKAVREEILSDLSVVSPSAVQKLAIPALLSEMRKGPSKRNKRGGYSTFLIAAETGSGKTLAYCLPIIDTIKRQELEQSSAPHEQAEKPTQMFELEPPDKERGGASPGPRAIILVPTAELVSQVGGLVKSLSHVVKFRGSLFSKAFAPSILRNRLFGIPTDIVVATPNLLDDMSAKKPDILSKCTYMVVDEADSLFDRSFISVTQALISRASNLQHLILCSATIPKSLDTKLRSLYPDLTRLATPNLHAVPRRVQLTVVDAESKLYHGNKMLACADCIYNIAKEEAEPGFIKKVIVFVNRRPTAREVASYLRTKDIDADSFERDSSDRSSSKALELFTGPKKQLRDSLQGRRRVRVLVTTDIASRGLDTKTVKNVILYDAPHSSIDLLHRIGRTGRMNRRGRAFILMDRDTNKGWIGDLKTTMHLGGPLI